MRKNFVRNLLTIEEIVQDKLFKIPDYQRGYSWEEAQVNDLLNDIDRISRQDHKHYTGTIVISQLENSERMDIVDGQQRLTTIIILLRELYRKDTDLFSEVKPTYLIRSDDCYVLETNAETDHYFKEAIIGDKLSLNENIKSLKNLKNTKKITNKWLTQNHDRLETIYATVTQQLGFLCFAPEETKEIGIMFEVINNRGKALSELEKIKNYFIYYATIHDKPSLKRKINNNWKDLLKNLNNADIVSNEAENTFLRNCYLVFYSANKKKSWYVYDELKINYPPDDTDQLDEKIDQIKRFIDFIQEASKFYAYFFDRELFKLEYQGECKSEIHEILKQLRCHPVNASIFPLYLASMHYIYTQPEIVVQLLRNIEITNFRVYVLPNAQIARSDSNQGDLFHWAHWLFNHGAIKEVLECLEKFTRKLCPESVFVQSLTIDNDESIDYYHWTGIRFFLASFEAHLNEGRKESWDIEKILVGRKETKKEKKNDYLSREHIWANKNRLEDYPEDFIDKRRLGNFVLMGLSTNIQLQKEDIHKKVEYLIANSSISMLQVNNLKACIEEAWAFAKEERKWKRKRTGFFKEVATRLIDQRETELVKFALKRWAFEGEQMNRFMYIDSFKAEKQNEKYFLKEINA